MQMTKRTAELLILSLLHNQMDDGAIDETAFRHIYGISNKYDLTLICPITQANAGEAAAWLVETLRDEVIDNYLKNRSLR